LDLAISQSKRQPLQVSLLYFPRHSHLLSLRYFQAWPRGETVMVDVGPEVRWNARARVAAEEGTRVESEAV